jgi:hypothetical protein
MRVPKSAASWLLNIAFVTAVSFGFGPRPAQGGLHWRSEKTEELKVRLVAVLQHYPRSSFFANQEVFLAEQQFTADESRLIKLVYGFLPYQPPLSETGFDYAVVHEIKAARAEICDETISSVESTNDPEGQVRMQYSPGSPGVGRSRHRNPIPCYVTSADGYEKAVRDPETTNARY